MLTARSHPPLGSCPLWSGVLLLCWVPLWAWAQPPPAGPSSPPTVSFTLEHPPIGLIELGQPCQLTVRLVDASPGAEPVFVIAEGKAFARSLVPMQRDEEDEALFAVVTLAPTFADIPGPGGGAVRVGIAFAQRTGMRLERFLHRAVYLTVRPSREGPALADVPLDAADQRAARPPSPPASEPVETGTAAELGRFTEEDLLSHPKRPQAQGYWRQIGQLVGRQWSASADRAPTLAVRFRLHANGEAQGIHVEQSSGSPKIDEAALQAVLRAHPFPPFPPDLDAETIEMHVELGRSSPGR